MLKIKKLNEAAETPSYACPGDAGLDLKAVTVSVSEDYIEYGTGLAIEIPYGFAAFIFPRSSISNYSLILANSVGLVDSGYKGELKVRFKKIGDKDKIYNLGDKVAQLVLMPIAIATSIEIVEELTPTERGSGGFGHTGK